MNDLEMLMLAAKAAGLKVIIPATPPRGLWIEGLEDEWNPLEDDGDALRLAVKLGLAIRVLEKCVFVESDPETLLAFSDVCELEMFNGDPYAATRRAIVRAAAQIGEQHGN